MLFAILTIAGGLIASSSLIQLKNPNTRPWFEKVAPYQGALGIALLAYGVFHLVFRVMPNLGALTSVPLTAALVLGGLALNISIGLLLGYGLIGRFMATGEKGAAIVTRLAKIQVPLGLAAIGVGAMNLIGF